MPVGFGEGESWVSALRQFFYSIAIAITAASPPTQRLDLADTPAAPSFTSARLGSGLVLVLLSCYRCKLSC